MVRSRAAGSSMPGPLGSGKMLRSIPLALMFALLPPAACAEPEQEAQSRHTSTLGFSVILPQDWVALDPSSSRTDRDQLEADGRFSGLDRSLLNSALQKVRSGEFEFFFRRPFEGFAQNIAVRKRNLDLPADAQALSLQCTALPSSLRQSYGRDISPPKCDLRSVAGHTATYIEIEGPLPQTVNLQYQVQLSKGHVLAITASVLAANLPAVRDEFESIVHSMRIGSDAP